MIRINQLIIIALMSLAACSKPSDQKDSSNEKPSIDSTSQSTEITLNELDPMQSENFKNWYEFHKSRNPDFSLLKFVNTSTDTLHFIQGSVKATYQKGFDPIYRKFIVYSPDSNNYIDFDSYQWQFDDKNRVMVSPDQEINWVDLKERTVKRISFRGPSYRVEDVFWINNNKVALLELAEGKPMISVIDLNSRVSKFHTYPTSLDSVDSYAQHRLKVKGMDIVF